MPALPPRLLAQRRFVWLLWLALLTPIAQTTATWHAVSHACLDQTGEPDGKQAFTHTHCALCLAEAALSSGAIPGEPPSVPHPTALHEIPNTDSGRIWFVLTERPYESRAPPSAQR
jgi:hypothetical protein